jgi:CheY-like chemotaxis protein
MSEVKRILVVDDHFDTLRFLRSLLELADSRYEVVSVRSGEEAGLELRRSYDLLITDMRLPGVGGTEVARRAKKKDPELPIIVISGFAKELANIEEFDVDIFCYFRKPLDADAMLAAVHTALWGELPVESEIEADIIIEEEIVEETIEELVVDTVVTADIEKRLELLRMNTGAEQLLLGTITGELAAASGSLNYDIKELSKTLAANLRNTFTLADQLGTEEHQTIQYQTSKRFDVYTANVGEYHFITMFFDAQARRGRIGTVWVFIQRAIRDLQPLLANTKVEVVEKTVRRKKATEKTTSRSKEIIAKVAEQVPTAPVIAPPVKSAPVVSKAKPETIVLPPDQPAIYEPPPPLNLEPISDEDLKKLESLDFDDMGDMADDFWEAATAPDDQPLTGGVTFEEAMRQGVLPSTADSPLAAMMSGDENAAAEMPTEDDNGLALAEGLPDFLKMAAADNDEPEITLDLGPIEDDDFDLSGMPMGDGGGRGSENESEPDEALAALAEMNEGKQSTNQDQEADAFWNAIVSGDTGRSTSSDGMTFEDALERGLAEGQLDDGEPTAGAGEPPAGLEALDLGSSEDVDSFWDDAVEEVDGGFANGISWEEAKKKGLIPSDLDAND